MADIQSAAVRLGEEIENEEERRNRMKIYMVCPIT